MLKKGFLLVSTLAAVVLGEADKFRSMTFNGIGYQELVNPIAKSQGDDRKYRALVLSNKMRVMVVSDPKANQASAALAVGVGSMSEPPSMPGLAHFCEHLLFMGSKKYPGENDYDQHISSNGGLTNAMTSDDYTAYYFSVNHNSLESSLDRFAQFFISPLFSKDSVEKEAKAVDSEFKGSLQSDYWRTKQVMRSTLNKSHPFSRFTTGTYKTLIEIPKSKKIDPRKEVIKFYNHYYSANLMSLVVLGRESIDELKAMAVAKFSGVRETNATRPSFPHLPFSKETLGVQININPLEAGQSMIMQFPLPSEMNYYKEKPASFISLFLGHEGKGSVLAYLKKRGWCTSLGAGVSESLFDFAILEIQLDITPLGLKNKDVISQLMLEYIQLLRKNGATKGYFNEFKTISENEFRFKEKVATEDYTLYLANLLQHPGPISHSLKNDQVMSRFNKTLIRETLGCLTKENLILSVMTNSSEFNRVEPWYGTKYSVNRLPAYHPTGIKLHLPKKNPYIPDDFTLIQTESGIRMLRNTTQSMLWHSGNPTNTPRTSVRLLLKNSLVSSSPASQARMDILVMAIRESINEFGHDALLGGLLYQINANPTGISIFVEGYSQKLEPFFLDVLKHIKSIKLDKPKFEFYKKQIIQDKKNLEIDDLVEQLDYNTKLALNKNVWPHYMIVGALERTSYEQVIRFFDTALRSIQPVMLVCGNVNTSIAKRILDTSISILNPKFHSKKNLLPVRSILVPKGNLVVQLPVKDQDEPNSAVGFYIQTYKYPNKIRLARTKLLAHLLSEPTFNQLRTKEQLGYIVFAKVAQLHTTGGIQITVQGEYDPIYVESRIESFLKGFGSLLISLPQEKFNLQVNSLISKLQGKQRNLEQAAKFYWRSITSGYTDFDRESTEISILKQTKKSHIVKLFKKSISKDSKDRKKLSIHLVSSQSKPHKGSNYTLADCGTLVKNITQWRDEQKLTSYPIPLKN